MGKTERKDGYYWVKLNNAWEIARWDGTRGLYGWTKANHIGYNSDMLWSEIGPRIPEYKPKKRK